MGEPSVHWFSSMVPPHFSKTGRDHQEVFLKRASPLVRKTSLWIQSLEVCTCSVLTCVLLQCSVKYCGKECGKLEIPVLRYYGPFARRHKHSRRQPRPISQQQRPVWLNKGFGLAKQTVYNQLTSSWLFHKIQRIYNLTRNENPRHGPGGDEMIH